MATLTRSNAKQFRSSNVRIQELKKLYGERTEYHPDAAAARLGERFPLSIHDSLAQMEADERATTPASTKRNTNTSPKHTEFPMNAITKTLMTIGAEQFIEFTKNPNPGFENRNANRDAFLTHTLVEHDLKVKPTAAAIATKMRAAKVPPQVLTATLEALCYSVLKNCFFSGWVAYRRALNALDGKVPDAYFEHFNNPPIDRREEEAPAPMGLEASHVEILDGIEMPITDSLPSEVADAIEDLRIHLENVLQSYGWKGDRLPFFIEQAGDKWIRHTGDVRTALADYERMRAEKNALQTRQTERFFEREAYAIRDAA